MDLSALIFVALAVAWAVYLIPKALKQHEDSANARSIETFSDRLRVVGRREAVSASAAALVTTRTAEPRAAREAGPTDAAWSPAELRRHRAAAAHATERRRRVVSILLLGLFTVSVLVLSKVIAPIYLAIPCGLLALWLIACRLMVRREIARIPARRPAPATAAVVDQEDDTEEITAVAEKSEPEPADAVEGPTSKPEGWDPVPTTLPTYVAKEPAARRTVRTIDLDSTGVWSSGRNAADAELVRGAEASERSQREAEAALRRAAGS